jgi:hypothetical protein
MDVHESCVVAGCVFAVVREFEGWRRKTANSGNQYIKECI